MKKFKLIKEYPGSPKLGTEVEKRNGKIYMPNSFLIFRHSVEEYPEFWEEIEKVITELVVFTKNNLTTTELWNPVLVKRFNSDRKYIDNISCFGFKTREEADEFILLNKPCLSYNDVKEKMRCQVSQYGILESIYGIVKSRL